MPYDVRKDSQCKASMPWAVVKDDGTVMGCHETQKAAQEQQRALYANEPELKAAIDDIDFTPPKGVREEAKRGLQWRREFNRGGTAVGVVRARDLSNGKSISPETAKRMKAYFDRHEVDKKGEGFSPGEKGFPSAGRIAWALWGGDAGQAWANKLVRQIEAQMEATQNQSIRFNATGSVELSAAEGKPPRFVLHAYSGGVMNPKLAIRWSGPVVVDLGGMQVRSETLPVHRDHDTSRPVGHTTEINNDGSQLSAVGVFSIVNQDSQELIDSGKAGFPWKASVGLSINQYTTTSEGQSTVVNGREFEGPILIVTQSTLEEISFVSVAGDPETATEVLAKLGKVEAQQMPTFEEWVGSLGLDPANVSEQLMIVLKTQYSEVMEEMVPPVADATAEGEMPAEEVKPAMATAASEAIDLRAQLASETQRAAEIRSLCAKFGNPSIQIKGKSVDVAAHAILNGWSEEKTELTIRKQKDLEASREARPQGPAIHSKSSSQTTMASLQAAMLIRGGADVESNKWQQRKFRDACKMDWLRASINSDQKQAILEDAYRFRNSTLLELTAHALRTAGQEVPVDRTDLLQAAFSTSSVANLFGATIGARVLEGYNEIRDFTDGWTTESENPDMESHNRIRMTASQNLSYLPIGGEADHAYRSLATETIRVERFAKQMEIDEADLLGDNFNKLADTPRDFGLAAGRLRPDLAANILLANANLSATGRALFNTTDGNKFGSAALARATLSAAIAAMAKFKDGDASIGLAASHLVVPPDLLDTAIQLTQSQNNVTSNVNEGQINPIARYGIVAVGEPRLANGVVDPVAGTSRSGSTSTWYLVSREARTIEFVYLQGAGRAPVVRTSQLVNGRFGINIDVRHYVGAKALDWRGMVYNQSASL